MGWKDKKTGMFPGKEMRIKGNKEQRSRIVPEDIAWKTPEAGNAGDKEE